MLVTFYLNIRFLLTNRVCQQIHTPRGCARGVCNNVNALGNFQRV